MRDEGAGPEVLLVSPEVLRFGRHVHVEGEAVGGPIVPGTGGFAFGLPSKEDWSSASVAAFTLS